MTLTNRYSQNKLTKKGLKRQIEEGIITIEIRSHLKKELTFAEDGFEF